ncbi:hypothetical protein AVEN_216505-1 [Araneus ventricosus]|uniref:Uncharacterized protein n=1 Tax=Araneus ventricosus TaxID=182803 RepID=A0A4Y2Q0L9_ARAVE|nr:hypothetical protein AVEN_216505-1 [Araneus ventricosus]
MTGKKAFDGLLRRKSGSLWLCVIFSAPKIAGKEEPYFKGISNTQRRSNLARNVSKTTGWKIDSREIHERKARRFRPEDIKSWR